MKKKLMPAFSSDDEGASDNEPEPFYPTPLPSSTLNNIENPSSPGPVPADSDFDIQSRRLPLVQAASCPLNQFSSIASGHTQTAFAPQSAQHESFTVRSPLSNVEIVRVPLSGRPITIGRSRKSSDVVISRTNKLISRCHASLELSTCPKTNAYQITVQCFGWNGLVVCAPDGSNQYTVERDEKYSMNYMPGTTLLVHGERALIALESNGSDETEEELDRTQDEIFEIGQDYDPEHLIEHFVDNSDGRTASHLQYSNSEMDLVSAKKRKPNEEETSIEQINSAANGLESDHSIVMESQALGDKEPKESTEIDQDSIQPKSPPDALDSKTADSESSKQETMPTEAKLPVETKVVEPMLDVEAVKDEKLGDLPTLDVTGSTETTKEKTPEPKQLEKSKQPEAPAKEKKSQIANQLEETARSRQSTPDPYKENKENIRKKKRQQMEEEEGEDITLQEEAHEIVHVVSNHLAFSRLSQTPISHLCKNIGALKNINKTSLRQVLKQVPWIGVINRAGKDAAGKPLEEEYYYIAESDLDEGRRMLVEQARGGTSLRSCRRTHKQYFWKKPAAK